MEFVENKSNSLASANLLSSEIFAVSLDDDEASWKKAVEKDSLNGEYMSDLAGSDSKAGLIYGINAIPDNFLINEEGIIIG